LKEKINLLREKMNAKERLGQQFERNWQNRYRVGIKIKRPYPQDHSQNVSRWPKITAQKLSLPEKKQKEIKLAAKFHDLHKISVPNQILNKPGKLHKEQYAEIKKYLGLGAGLSGKAMVKMGLNTFWFNLKFFQTAVSSTIVANFEKPKKGLRFKPSVKFVLFLKRGERWQQNVF